MSDQNKNNRPAAEEAGKTVRLSNGELFEIPANAVSVDLKDVQMMGMKDGKTMEIKIDSQMFANKGGNPVIQVSAPPPTVKVSAPPPVAVIAPPPPKAKTVKTKEPVVRLVSTGEAVEMNLREENVQEILTAVPHWMIRWGNTLFGSLIFLLIVLAWWIKYPDKVETRAMVVNKFPAQMLFVAEGEELAEVLVNPGDKVAEGEVVAVRHNRASFTDVLLLQSILDTVSVNSKGLTFPFHVLPTLALGDLQVPFAQFENSYLHYAQDREKISQARRQLYDPASGGVSGTALQSHGLYQQTAQDYQALKEAIASWDEQYLLRAKQAGQVEKVLADADTRQAANNLLMSISPEQPPHYVAQLELPSYNGGKLQAGQKVLVKLDNYPEMEFGILEGVLAEGQQMKSNDAGEVTYHLEAELPKRLLTSYDLELNYQEQLKGSGQIITGEARLLQRFLNIIQ